MTTLEIACRQASMAMILAVAATTVAAPPPRGDHAATYDPVRKRVVLFGGLADTTPLTWEFDSRTWSLACGGCVGPTDRADAAMGYSSQTSTVVLFGGIDADAQRLGDTWEFDGREWRPLPGHLGEGRSGSSMSFDSATRSLLLFGGVAGSGQYLSDLRELTSIGWVPREASGGAGIARAFHVMVDLPRLQGVVVYGGVRDGEILSDVWLLSSGVWKRLVAAGEEPTARYDSAAAVWRGSLVAIGGSRGETLHDVAVLDSDGWRETIAPVGIAWSARHGHSLVPCESCGGLVLFGGYGMGEETLGDTWLVSLSEDGGLTAELWSPAARPD